MTSGIHLAPFTRCEGEGAVALDTRLRGNDVGLKQGFGGLTEGSCMAYSCTIAKTTGKAFMKMGNE